MRHFLITSVFGLAAFSVQADIYKCLNEYGHATYSNVQAKGCVRVVASPVARDAGPAPKQSKTAVGGKSAGAPRTSDASGRGKTASPADFPRVDPSTQRRRDDGRRRILDTELAHEQTALDKARRQLLVVEAQSASSAEVRAAREQVDRHERNIDALRKELALDR